MKGLLYYFLTSNVTVTSLMLFFLFFSESFWNLLTSLGFEFSWKYCLLRILFHPQCWHAVYGPFRSGNSCPQFYKIFLAYSLFSLFSFPIFAFLPFPSPSSLPSLSFFPFFFPSFLPNGASNYVVLFYFAYLIFLFFLSRGCRHFLSYFIEFLISAIIFLFSGTFLLS